MGRISVKQRDIFLVPFPFSDQTGGKVRPVLLLSNNCYNDASQDVIVCAITTKKRGNYSFPVKKDHLESGILHHSCFIKVENILKISNKLLIKNIGTLRADRFGFIRERMMELF